MRVADVLLALPGIVLFSLLPGLSAARLLMPTWRRWERVAVAPGLGAGVVGVLGLMYHDLHFSFRAATVVPVLAVFALAAHLKRPRRGRDGRVQATEAQQRALPGARLVVVCALAAGAVSAIVFAVSMHGRVLPLQGDAPVHGEVAAAIERQHDAIPAVPEPADATAWVRPRAALEAQVALTAEIDGPDVARGLLPLTLVAVVLIPLGLAAIALELTGSALIAGLAPLLGLGMGTPTFALVFGEFPLLVDSTLVAAVVLATVRWLRGGNRRDVAALGAAVAAIWVTHGLEIATALVVTVPAAGAVLFTTPTRRSFRRVLAGLVSAGAGALAVSVLTRTPSVEPALLSSLAGSPADLKESFIGRAPGISIPDALRIWNELTFSSTAQLVLWGGGVLAAIRLMRLRGLALMSLGLVAAFYDTAGSAHLRRIWGPLYPWSVPDRLAAIQYWAAPLLMALGVVAAMRVAGSALSRLRISRRHIATMAATATAAAAVAVAVLGWRWEGSVVDDATSHTAAASDADVRTMQLLAGRLPDGAVVLTQGTGDSGQWLDVITPLVAYFSKPYQDVHPDDAHLAALAGACQHPEAVMPALKGIDAVYVGSQPAGQGGHAWTPRCLAAVPGLVPVAIDATDGGPAAFLVRHG